ncbi:MAG: hydantoinase/oxoprolinase family protein, partial [Thermodesulfobacteriota bacterium]|nr:hydantoinase/oxoprolinase family protein [Thermodesulfobacteriota bacterium]
MYKVAIDTGGTFTDVVCLEKSEKVKSFKSLTTEDYVTGVIDVLKKTAKYYGMDILNFLKNVDLLIHGTTMATNTMLTGKGGAKTGMITTKNFRDIIELRRGIKLESTYNIKIPPPKVFCPRYLRLVVEERILNTGEVQIPLKEEGVLNAIKAFKEDGVESIAICFLFSYINPEHEIRTEDILRSDEKFYIARSSKVLPYVREFTRFNTTVISAYLGPATSRYFKELSKKLKDFNYQRDLVVMQGSGGVQSVQACIENPVSIINSGPAAAPVAGIYFGKIAGFENIISIDTGGTSFDVTFCKKESIPVTNEKWIENNRLGVNMVDVNTLGAGGGSIAFVDEMNVLDVGPVSAGSVPGPACYDKGGEEPTVTDAALILGYISPDSFLGGEFKLNVDKAQKAIEEKVADKLNLNITEAAAGIFNIINTKMADGIDEVFAETGYDPRDFCLICGGGAGPVHGVRIAEKVKIPHLLVPKHASCYSSFGMLFSDHKHELVRSYPVEEGELNLDVVNNVYNEMAREGIASLKNEGISDEDMVIIKSVDMRYTRQFKEVEVGVPSGNLDKAGIEKIINTFHGRHDELYNFSFPGMKVMFLYFRLKAVGVVPKPAFEVIPKRKGNLKDALKETRECFFDEDKKYIQTSIYAGDKLLQGDVIAGPGIIEESTTNLVVPPGF